MKTYKLSGETIDFLSDKIGETYKQCGCTNKEIYRAKLLLEEALLKYMSKFGEDIEINFRQYHVFNQTRFQVRILCPSFDPFITRTIVAVWRKGQFWRMPRLCSTGKEEKSGVRTLNSQWTIYFCRRLLLVRNFGQNSAENRVKIILRWDVFRGQPPGLVAGISG